MTSMVKPLIKEKVVQKKLQTKPCAVVMGKTGAGKTTLVNALCGTTHESGAGAGSITRNLFRNDVNCGKNAFSLIDTPGTNSSSETFKHALLLRQALTSTKINTIFIIIKYECRFDTIVESYLEVEQPVFNYGSKIVLMISYLDQSKEPEKDFPQICKLFQDDCPYLANIIFYSEQSSNIELANLMYGCISGMKEETLQISDQEFFLKFNIYEIKRRIKGSYNQYKIRANSLLQDYSNLITSVNSESPEDRDGILHMLIVEFKNEMEILLQKFRQENGGEMQELDYYTFYIKMEKENVKLCDSFVEQVVPLMSYNLFDNQDPRNLIKKCPFCDLIWFKTEGCDGMTSCGNNGFSNYFDLSHRPSWKYIVRRVNGKLCWTKNPMEENLLEHPTRSNEKVSFSATLFRSVILSSNRSPTNSKRVGCGKTFKWSELPKIEDDLILELFKVKTIEQAKQLIQNGHFSEIRQNYESSIDLTFHS